MVSLVLIVPGQRRKTILRYGPAFSFSQYADKAEPAARWLTPRHLEIAIGAVAFIEYSRDHVDEVRISYDIAHVIFADKAGTRSK